MSTHHACTCIQCCNARTVQRRESSPPVEGVTCRKCGKLYTTAMCCPPGDRSTDEAGPALPTRADLNASETPFDDLIAAYASVRRETFEACAKLCETWAREERVEVDGTTFVRNPVQVEAGRILASMIRTAADSVSKAPESQEKKT